MGGWLLLVVAVAAVVGGLWFMTKGKPLGGSAAATGIDALASVAPAETQVFVAFDVRAQWPPEKVLARLDELKKQVPDLAKRIDEVEGRAGLKIADMVKWVSPAGFVAFFPRDGQKSLVSSPWPDDSRPFEVVSALSVSDEAVARQQLERIAPKMPTPPTAKDQDGLKVWTFSSGKLEMVVALGHKFVWWASSADALSRAVRVVGGSAPSLYAQTRYTEARKRASGQAGLFGYAALRDIVAPLGAMPEVKGRIDEQTMLGLQSLQWVIASADFADKNGEGVIFVSVDPTSTSPFAKALLTAHPLTSPLAKLFPTAWGNYTAFNVSWLGTVLYQAAMLAPEARTKLGLGLGTLPMQLGFDPVGEFQKASDGDIAYATDAFLKMPEIVGGSFQGARAQGQATACASNLKNIGTACEMYSTDNAGRFPKTLLALTPDYLRHIPTCPAAGTDTYSVSFQSTVGPDTYRVACSGHHHTEAGLAENMPAFTSTLGLVGYTPSRVSRPLAMPTYMVAIGLKDATGARGLVERVEQKARLSSSVMKTVEGIEIRGYGAVPLRWALVSQPLSALLLAVGPEAEARLVEMLATAKKPAESIDAVANLQAMISEAQGKAEQVSYADLSPLLKMAIGLLKDLPSTGDSDRETKAFIVKLFENLQVQSVSVVGVEKDGLILRSRGLGMPMIAVGGIAAAIMVPGFLRAREAGQATACKSNLKNIGTALEMYSTDNGGRFPTSLSQLAPNYLKHIPTCPAAGNDTYSTGFKSLSNPDAYTVFCGGSHHTGAGFSAGYPQYTSTQGILER